MVFLKTWYDLAFYIIALRFTIQIGSSYETSHPFPDFYAIDPLTTLFTLNICHPRFSAQSGFWGVVTIISFGGAS